MSTLEERNNKSGPFLHKNYCYIQTEKVKKSCSIVCKVSSIIDTVHIRLHINVFSSPNSADKVAKHSTHPNITVVAPQTMTPVQKRNLDPMEVS